MGADMPSAKELAARRRQELFAERSFELPLIGYEGVYAVRYRALSYEELRKIGSRNDRPGVSDDEKELIGSADTLINACLDILDVTGDEPVSTGCRWSASTAAELFDVDLPPDATARQAVRAVLPSLEMMRHFADYDSRLTVATADVDRESEGESEAA